MKHFILAALLLDLCASVAFAQWQTQTIDTKADFRGLCVVSPKVAWVSGSMGTFGRTTDGKNWSVGTVPGADKLDFRAACAFGATTAYLLSAGPGEASRIYKTIDGGKSWTLQFKSADPAAFFDAIAFWDEKNGIALGDPVKGMFQMIVTTDGGANWKPLAPKKLPAALSGEGAFAASGTCIVTHGKSDVWFATGSAKTARVFHSKDRGQNWEVSETPIAAGAESAGIFSIAFRDKHHGMIVGGDYKKPNDTGKTAALTADGGKTWTSLDKRLPYRSAVAWAKDRWVAVGTSGSHVSLDDGATWKLLDRENYNSVGFTATGEGWAVGPKGRIENAEKRATPLMLAARRGNLAVVKRLLAAGADVNYADKYDSTPLSWSILEKKPGHETVMKALLAAGAKSNYQALVGAARTGSPAMIEMLAASGADVNEVSRWGTALVLAAHEKRVDTTESLLRVGADPHLRIPDTHRNYPNQCALDVAKKRKRQRLSRSWRPHSPGNAQPPRRQNCSTTYRSCGNASRRL